MKAPEKALKIKTTIATDTGNSAKAAAYIPDKFAEIADLALSWKPDNRPPMTSLYELLLTNSDSIKSFKPKKRRKLDGGGGGRSEAFREGISSFARSKSFGGSSGGNRSMSTGIGFNSSKGGGGTSSNGGALGVGSISGIPADASSIGFASASKSAIQAAQPIKKPNKKRRAMFIIAAVALAMIVLVVITVVSTRKAAVVSSSTGDSFPSSSPVSTTTIFFSTTASTISSSSVPSLTSAS